jgi:N-acetylneuraminate lyase
MDFFSCLNYENGRFDLLWGRDECLLSALATGCKGAVGSTYNYAAPLYHKLIRSFNEGDMDQARRMQQISVNIVSLLDKFGGMATGKAFMRYIGMGCGKFRSPVRNFNDDVYEDFVKQVRLLDIDEFLSRK